MRQSFTVYPQPAVTTFAFNFFKSKTELPDVASEYDLELLVVEAVDDGVDAGVEVANPQDVQVQAVGRLDFLQNDLLV